MPWLMKAEPDSRIVKGKDVRFSVDDFEKLGTSQWDGVRNHEAKKIMKERMKLGDKVLFYHSNTKTPGVFGIAEVAREGYPDYTAFDAAHPYHDPKSRADNPTWFMVDVKFNSRVQYPPTLQLVKLIASSTELPNEITYIGPEGHKAIKEMHLVNRGRLSVQPVTQEAYDTVILLGERGGWDDLVATPAAKKAKAAKAKAEVEAEIESNKTSKKQSVKEDVKEEESAIAERELAAENKVLAKSSAKRKAAVVKEEISGESGVRRSTRRKVA